jgi:hypothetical protein
MNLTLFQRCKLGGSFVKDFSTPLSNIRISLKISFPVKSTPLWSNDLKRVMPTIFYQIRVLSSML